ncbi:MAG: DEAD/DEAH box helicase [Solirubrobacteraceae bacterium]|nr:DEAD/DEAH box helicase [Solirubrobacteraceae bacterium]
MSSSPSADPWSALLAGGRDDGRLVREAFEGARPASTAPLPDVLHPDLRDALRRRGVERLYAHQAAAVAVPSPRPFVVTTGTASGKSLCFQLPLLDALLREPGARALLLYPTKALAQDQARSLASFGLGDRLPVAIYDGDTPREARRDVRTRARIVITNPDMLHVGILPRPDLWTDFLVRLRIVVVDEAHVYRGVFGSHVANVLRRLRRVAARAQGTVALPGGGRAARPARRREDLTARGGATGRDAARPDGTLGDRSHDVNDHQRSEERVRFLLASATIANPVEHAEALTGLDDVTLVDEDGSPSAGRRIAMWNPPLFDEDDDQHATAARVRRERGADDPPPPSNPDVELLDAAELIAGRRRRSALSEAADLLADLVESGASVICFVRSRKGVEVTAGLTADELEERRRPDLAGRVIAYRAGYTTAQRHDLERRLVAGEVRCVVTTSALELGIDIGRLDASVVVTFPGTVASLRQMWGRAGRRARGLAVYVAGEDALDQYFCRHPDDFLDRPVEAAIVRHENEPIHLAHLLCAAYEAPLDERDEPMLGPRWRAHAEELERHGLLRERRGAFRPTDGHAFPAGELGLRSATGRRVVIVDGSTGEELGHVEWDKAPATVHPGAVYLHAGARYEVQDLDLERGYAVVEPFSGTWWTEPKREIEITFERLLDHRVLRPWAGGGGGGTDGGGGIDLHLGEVTVTDTVLAYQRRRVGSGEVIDLHTVDLPSVSFRAEAVWYEPGPVIGTGGLDPSADDQGDGSGHVPFPSEHVLGSLHAAEHGQIAVLPLLAMCDRWDVGGLSTNIHPQTGGPTIIVYEGHVGGVGIARQAFREFETWTDDARRMIRECPCESGCPSCVQSPKCGNLNEPLHKAGALELLNRVAAGA